MYCLTKKYQCANWGCYSILFCTSQYHLVPPTDFGSLLTVSCGPIWYRSARSAEQHFWSSLSVLQGGTVDFCLFPVVQAIQKHSLGRNLGKAINHCFQEPLVKFSHSWSCLELESCITAWRGSSKQTVSQGQSQITEITPIHALAAETMRVFI